MKSFKVFMMVLCFLPIPLSTMAASKAPLPQTSGKIEGGLRLLDVAPADSNLEFTIYRGDYIVFNFTDGKKHEFQVPDLEIDLVMPKPASEKPYVKMKKSGDYAFSLGERDGVFHVLELVAESYQELSAAEAMELIENVPPRIIDVRTQREYDAGHIIDADLLPVQVFSQNIDKLESFRDENILLYCASGNRSTVAAKMLIDAGFIKVYNLRRGFRDWKKNNLPVK